MAIEHTLLYKGHTVTVSDEGVFSCTVGGISITATTFIGCKRKVDAHVGKEFKPFSALLDNRWGRDYSTVKVTGITHAGSRYARRGKSAFVIVNNESRQRVVQDSPENRETIKKLLAHRKKREETEERLRKEEEEMQRRIVWLEADAWLEQQEKDDAPF